MKEHTSEWHTEDPIKRAIREANEQEEAKTAQVRAEAETVKGQPVPPPPREVLLALKLQYDISGTCVGIEGFCSARRVLRWTGRGDLSVGRAAKETLKLGALGALLGR
jgi:hypothetical protein